MDAPICQECRASISGDCGESVAGVVISHQNMIDLACDELFEDSGYGFRM